MKMSSINGSDAVQRELRGINVTRKQLADGSYKLYYYHRGSGKRLPDDVDSPEFLAAFVAAETPLRDGGTLAGLIRSYCASPDYLNRAESARKIAKYLFKIIEDEYGDMTVGAINNKKKARAEFLEWRDGMVAKRGARAADNILAHLQRVLSWAEDRGELDENPLYSFKRAYKNNRSEFIWLPEYIEVFNKSAPLEMREALLLALETGQRQGDLLRLPWSAYRDGAVGLKQHKGKVRVWVPCTARLKAMLDGMKRKSPLILTMPNGQPWKARYFSDQWRKASNEAGFPELNFHDLRGTAMTSLSEAGCTPQQIASITGHTVESVNRMLEVYMARTKDLAAGAIARLESYRNSK